MNTVVGMNTMRQELAVAAASLRSCLEQQRAAGIHVLPAGSQPGRSEVPARGEERHHPGDLGRPVRSEAPGPESPAAGDETRAAASLAELRDVLGDCRRCKLWQGRSRIVYGVGNADADVLFVGEGPGRDEDLQGEPFVGRAGQLLTDIITKGMKLRREDVYIANVVKCRPPNNRDPEPDEVAACEPFLLRQIELVKPRVVVALGRFAVQTLLRSAEPVSRLRGKWHDYHGIRLMPTFHPAYLLRNPGDKRLVWEDIKSVLRELETAVP